jgi:hypothetical protein
MISRIATSAVALTVCMFAGCGGGGDSTGSSSPPPTPQPTTLAASGGDLSRYLGLWVSECGITVSGVGEPKSQISTFNFTLASDMVLSGTLTVQRFADLGCVTPAPVQPMGPVAITATYQGDVTVTSGNPPTMQGSADQFALSQVGVGGSQALTVGFYSDYSKFRQGSTAFFSAASLSYSKR